MICSESLGVIGNRMLGNYRLAMSYLKLWLRSNCSTATFHMLLSAGMQMEGMLRRFAWLWKFNGLLLYAITIIPLQQKPAPASRPYAR
jgi:hypothetical protein